MVSSWCLVSPQARDSGDPGPLPGQRPPFLPVRYLPGRRLQDPQGPCLQSLLRSRSRAFGASHFGGGEPADDLLGRGRGPSIRCQCPVVPRFRVTGPSDSLLLVRGNVSRGPEGAEFLLVPLYVSYLGSCCPSQCIGVRVPGNRPADPRGRPTPESPILSAAVRICGLPLGPSSGVLGGVSPPGAAPAAPVGSRRPGPARRSPGYLGRRAVPASVRPGPSVGAAHQRRQALPRPGFLRSRGGWPARPLGWHTIASGGYLNASTRTADELLAKLNAEQTAMLLPRSVLRKQTPCTS
ncbi:hypothetical protein NDU88_005562 [Pleurodeles waltl]|uniref:Uncharacterized protein n=1 Tax=Pleurodeles waltl TaxID=8319 RepID=A0AAV7M9P2_PLEWA|nr:hypothetical protein NDU88_005562 [Pleurodeles waltl]